MARIALLGTGLLGGAIGRRLLEGGHQLQVWNRTPAKSQALLESGATAITSLPGSARNCDTVVSVLRDGPASSAVLRQLGDLNSACVMSMGTMAIAESQALEQQIDSHMRVVDIAEAQDEGEQAGMKMPFQLLQHRGLERQ